jgi:hypothetical protein
VPVCGAGQPGGVPGPHLRGRRGDVRQRGPRAGRAGVRPGRRHDRRGRREPAAHAVRRGLGAGADPARAARRPTADSSASSRGSMRPTPPSPSMRRGSPGPSPGPTPSCGRRSRRARPRCAPPTRARWRSVCAVWSGGR